MICRFSDVEPSLKRRFLSNVPFLSFADDWGSVVGNVYGATPRWYQNILPKDWHCELGLFVISSTLPVWRSLLSRLSNAKLGPLDIYIPPKLHIFISYIIRMLPRAPHGRRWSLSAPCLVTATPLTLWLRDAMVWYYCWRTRSRAIFQPKPPRRVTAFLKDDT